MQNKATKKPEKESKFKEAKKALKRNFKVNTKMTFTEDGEMVQQWPPLQRTAVPAGSEDEGTSGGINVFSGLQGPPPALWKEALSCSSSADVKANEKLSPAALPRHASGATGGVKDVPRTPLHIFMQNRIGKEKRLKEKAARRDASKRQKEEQMGESNSEEEEEVVAYLDCSDDEEEFDPSSLPDPDKHVDSESEDKGREASGKGVRKRGYSDSSSDSNPEEFAGSRKRTRKEDPTGPESRPLDTGLSLAEDEEL
ncbi:hypothetical protein JZ751_023148, partial [Albula glossodonta]